MRRILVTGAAGQIGSELVPALCRRHGADRVVATGLGFPVVPRGEEEIRFQISADHTPFDVDEALRALESFGGR